MYTIDISQIPLQPSLSLLYTRLISDVNLILLQPSLSPSIYTIEIGLIPFQSWVSLLYIYDWHGSNTNAAWSLPSSQD